MGRTSEAPWSLVFVLNGENVLRPRGGQLGQDQHAFTVAKCSGT